MVKVINIYYCVHLLYVNARCSSCLTFKSGGDFIVLIVVPRSPLEWYFSVIQCVVQKLVHKPETFYESEKKF